MFNQSKLAEYRRELSPLNQQIFDRVISNTVYFSTNEVIDMVRASLGDFHRATSGSPYNLYVPNNKIGSESLMLLELKEDLHPMKIIYGVDEILELDNDYPILILDDMVLSSHNMCGHIDELTYARITMNQPPLINQFHICVAICGRRDPEVVQLFGAIIHAQVYLDELGGDVLLSDLISEVSVEEYLYSNFQCDKPPYPLILEHKIANEFGSYGFYHHLVNSPPDRSRIDRITEEQIMAAIGR